jgi:hypothetical protein
VTDSFELKLIRADHHLKELKREIERFTDEHPYEAIQVGGTNRKRRALKWKLHFTEQPNEMVAVIVGDIVHNIRSALDHLIVSHVPRKRRWDASFPIFKERPYGADGVPFDNELGKSWTKAVSGLKKPHLAVVKLVQPFGTPDQETLDYCEAFKVDPMDIHSLNLLSRFDNADKHRKLIAIPHGLENAVVTARAHGDEIRPQNVHTLSYFVEDGAQLLSLDIDTLPPNRKMHVQVSGTPRVALQVRTEHAVAGLPGTLERILGHARDIVSWFRNPS